jgi:pterin-4a-carbinolamine dehydratase
MSVLSVFISYRRDTDAARAVMLDRVISGAFNYPKEPPKVNIYRDTSERLGVSWPQEIRDRCSTADIVLVVIGPNWLEARDLYARRRIDQEDDWVRKEIELALNSNKTIIPIAFGLLKIPPPAALPESITGLANWRGIPVRDEFPDDLQPVLREIEMHLPESDREAVRSDVGGSERRLPYPDPPLVVKPAPMSENDIKIAIHELLNNWEIVSSPLPEDPDRRRVELHRTFTFRRFLDVLEFMIQVADFADKANHHPRWENLYETLRVNLTTWDIGHRISQLDIQLAQYFDRAYQQYCNSADGAERSSKSR